MLFPFAKHSKWGNIDNRLFVCYLIAILLHIDIQCSQARRVKKLHSALDGDLSLGHHTRLQLHKGNINSIHHGPKYSTKHDKLAKKKAKYYKKLLGKNLKYRIFIFQFKWLVRSCNPSLLANKMIKDKWNIKTFRERLKNYI